MCGIAGIFSLEHFPELPSQLKKMNAAIAHRGPDDEGYVEISREAGLMTPLHGDESVREFKETTSHIADSTSRPTADIGLAHRRFSIIDLHSRAHQPFFDTQKTCCLVFNGEIYNYREIKKYLIGKGHTFRTESDTEVFVESYKHWSYECFSHFNGFWSAALYDSRTNELILSRDRIGKKQIYYAVTGGRLYFASEIKALLSIESIGSNAALNEPVARGWLIYGRQRINEQTFFTGIQSFPAASYAVFSLSVHPSPVHYWRFPRTRLKVGDLPLHEASRELKSRLTESVRLRLIADVPIGVELSGGMDSSVIAALSATVSKEKPTVYTVRYTDAEEFEEPYARKVAQRYNLPYTVLDIPPSNLLKEITRFTWLLEEPFHSPNIHANQLMWREMRARGIRVSLNGGGGDECLAGYSHYYRPAQWELMLQGRISDALRNVLKYSENKSVARSSLEILLHGLGRRFFDILPLIRSGALRYRKGMPAELYTNSSTLSQQLLLDMERRTMPYWMASGDRDTMGVPIEVRLPFLDYNVLEWTFRMPISYLIANGWHKWVLRHAFQDMLPNDVVWRKRKMGFPFPLGQFLRQNSAALRRLEKETDIPNALNVSAITTHGQWCRYSFLLWKSLFIDKNSEILDQVERSVSEDPPKEAAYVPRYYDSFSASQTSSKT